MLSNNAKNNARIYYEKRFKIEKNYQDCKSSGYDIEKNKIRKYDRFKRMMYLVVLAHALTCIIGHVRVTRNSIKKTLRNRPLKHEANLSTFRIGYEAISVYYKESMHLFKRFFAHKLNV